MFVSSIVLYTFYIIVLLSFDEVPDLCCIVDAGACKLGVFVLPLTPRGLNNTLPTPRRRHFSILGDHVAFLYHSACCLGLPLAFFSLFCELATTAKTQCLATTVRYIYDR